MKIGNTVHVSGTTGTKEGRVVSPDAYGQAVAALRIIDQALRDAGASMKDVVRTRIYVTGREHCEAVGRAHGEVFSSIRPASAMVVVAGLIDPAMLVEIEADAVVEATS